MPMSSEKEPIEIELDDTFGVTLHSVELDRNEDGEVKRLIYNFHLHFGGGYTTLPVTMTEFDAESMDQNWKDASSILYQILASLTEVSRRKGDYRLLSFR